MTTKPGTGRALAYIRDALQSEEMYFTDDTEFPLHVLISRLQDIDERLPITTVTVGEMRLLLKAIHDRVINDITAL